ncbi:hypothetical protein GLAREA_07933 [Glarea lozoyensis ATCC 20868]|uniref:Uncharacterized protein n=1 Tax=Glarea lozoyensis (strain ATCC 20868 / MF5171) TaxID=1116229 RepID=S3D6S0_GLAL2|nr:uncharacterized protein GLAREA_07933 [Glarea lozoyensis ATCC 20868]EPE32799.1 hypothetical protein GLAREA_07933 [Glarea lozoyensis ATCC 20868]
MQFLFTAGARMYARPLVLRPCLPPSTINLPLPIGVGRTFHDSHSQAQSGRTPTPATEDGEAQLGLPLRNDDAGDTTARPSTTDTPRAATHTHLPIRYPTTEKPTIRYRATGKGEQQFMHNETFQRIQMKANSGLAPDSLSNANVSGAETTQDVPIRYPTTEKGEQRWMRRFMYHRIKIKSESRDAQQAENGASTDMEEDEDPGDFSDFVHGLRSLVVNTNNPALADGRNSESASSTSSLPKSPLLNPDIINPNLRRKTRPSKSPTPFQIKLDKNVYARAIATPVRICQLTRIALPRFFLQQIRLVASINPKNRRRSVQYIPGGSLLWQGDRKDRPAMEYLDNHNAENVDWDDKEGGIRRSQSSGSGVYVVARQSAISALSSTDAGYGRTPRRVLMPPSQCKNKRVVDMYRHAHFYADMDQFILKLFRQRVRANILSLVQLRKGYLHEFDSWDAAQVHSPQASAFLWLGLDGNPPPEFATILHRSRPLGDPKKLPVHNLRSLLSREDIDWLREKTQDIPIFWRPVVAVKARRMTITLQQQLWQLQCYIAEHKDLYSNLN